MKLLHVWQRVALVSCAVLLTHGNLRAQNEQSVAQSPTISLELRSADQIAVSNKSEYKVHIRTIKGGPTGHYSPLATTASSLEGLKGAAGVPADKPADASVPGVPAPGFYPADLSRPLAGPVVTSAESHPVYVDCAETCWGNPAKFLHNLFKSDFIHVADQYVGSTAHNRYTVGTAEDRKGAVYCSRRVALFDSLARSLCRVGSVVRLRRDGLSPCAERYGLTLFR